MDINRINNLINSNYGDEPNKDNKTNTNANSAATGNHPQSTDDIHISKESARLNHIIEQVDNSPAIDEEKIAHIKSKIANGEYAYLNSQDPTLFENLANKIIDFESDIDNL